MALEKVNESALAACCPRNSRGSERIESPADSETLATANGFSKYVLRPLYHPCNELGMCRKALNGGIDAVVAGCQLFLRATQTGVAYIFIIDIRYYRPRARKKEENSITRFGSPFRCTNPNITGHRFPSIHINKVHIPSTETNEGQPTFDWA